jgi:hypothetical protein
MEREVTGTKMKERDGKRNVLYGGMGNTDQRNGPGRQGMVSLTCYLR